ncbi:MAG: homocysteine S-methyltransferase family protein [Verrucomicrobia bacterium]|nr:homocysteine S-methyltransferase family protein [Verrucomicrobiota bacterium]
MAGFLDLLRNEIVLGDGALGTLLHQRGQPLNACYDALNLTHPEIIHEMHREYLDAGRG